MVELAVAKLALKLIETRYNFRVLREGKRAHNVTDRYYTNITLPNTHIPFTYNVEAM